MALGGGRAQGSIHMFLICHWWEQGQSRRCGGVLGRQAQEGREPAAAAAAGKFGFREEWRERVQGRRGGTLGTRAVSWGRREQVVTCLSAQLFCVQEPERDRSSWEEKKPRGQGPSWSFCLSHRF